LLDASTIIVEKDAQDDSDSSEQATRGDWKMKRAVSVILSATLLSAAAGAGAQPGAPTRPPTLVSGQIAVPNEPDAIPLRPPLKGQPEQWDQRAPGYRGVRNVVNPTLIPVLPDPAKATGAAMIVAPGGAFRFLSIDAEGYRVARWLADHGVAAFVLKYRTVATPRDPAGYMAAMSAFMRDLPRDESKPLDATPEAVEDGQAAVRLIRQRASEWRIDPKRVGFIGFSAGAMTTLGVGLAPDAAARPDFIAPIYPPMMARPVLPDAPPMFLAIALDDPLFAKGRSLGLIDSWRQAGRPLEVHLYEKGGHGFSFNPSFHASSLYLDELFAWLKDRGIISAKP
jgi:acetyl esterase/lipase